jgi:hypothetical protein
MLIFNLSIYAAFLVSIPAAVALSMCVITTPPMI